MKKSDFALNVNPYLWEIGYFRYKRIFGARPIKPHFEPILYFKKLPLTRKLAKSKPAQKNRFRTGPKSEEVGGNQNSHQTWGGNLGGELFSLGGKFEALFPPINFGGEMDNYGHIKSFRL